MQISKMRCTRVIAHRGFRDGFPENSKEAIVQALNDGVDGVEFDVDLSRDGHAILIHQETFVPDIESRRIVPASSDAGRDWTQKYSADEIRVLDYGGWMGHRPGLISVAALEDLVELDWHGITAYVELKDPTYFLETPDDPARAQGIVDAILPTFSTFLAKGVGLTALSFNPSVLRLIRQVMPNIPAVLVLSDNGPNLSSIVRESVALAGVAIPIGCVDRFALERLKKSFNEVFAYESSSTAIIKDKAPGHLFKLWESCKACQVSGIITDYPRELKKFLA